ncbi:MAG TPA: YceI family protein [Gemmatimonadaceae bacterium]|nr:YceI family protein [Gemmatimonadaceae bacterium]
MTATSPMQGVSTWTIDPAHTLIEFSAKHMMITTVKGRLTDVKGALSVDEQNPDRSHVEVEFAAASIDTRAEQRDQHLRSADFLDVEKYPTVSFRSRKVAGARPEPGDTFKVVGDLTIRGTTREVTLDVTYEGRGRDPWGGERISFSADTKIDRRDYGLTWNAALEAGGVLVSNDIKVHLEVQAVRAA